MLVIMPKQSYYDALSPSIKPSVDKIINDTVNEFCNGTVQVLIEDELASNYFSNASRLSCTMEKELNLIKELNAYGDYTQFVIDAHSSCENIALNHTKIQQADIKLAFSDLEKYKKLNLQYYKQRAVNAVESYCRKKKVAIVFVGNKTSTTYVTPTAKENDGILYVYVELGTGNIYGMYSGIWVNKDIIGKVIGGLYE